MKHEYSGTRFEQYDIEQILYANGYDAEDLWYSISNWLSSDDVINFLRDFANDHDVNIPWD